MIVIMEHTISWLNGIGYDTSHYANGSRVEWKEHYVKITDNE